MSDTVTLDAVVDLARHLTVIDKIRLIEHVAFQIEEELGGRTKPPRKSLRGTWQGLDVSDEDIATVRREIWAGFPEVDEGVLQPIKSVADATYGAVKPRRRPEDFDELRHQFENDLGKEAMEKLDS